MSRDGYFAAALPMKVPLFQLCSLLLLVSASSGCTELRARQEAREGNGFFLQGDYSSAAEKYRAAEALLPTLPVVVFNKGLACRQQMLPGAKSPENERVVRCALEAFKRYQELRPSDPRGEQLYVQTLFDADRFETLVGIYEAELRASPAHLGSINGLIQVYSRWDRFPDALRWTVRRAEVASQDAEAQYAVGVLIWNRLFQKGGGRERATFDPRSESAVLPPPFAEDDITGGERVRLADLGISHLEKALSLREGNREAMTYLNLLYRQKSYAFFDSLSDFQATMDKAESWRKKAMQVDASQKAAPSSER